MGFFDMPEFWIGLVIILACFYWDITLGLTLLGGFIALLIYSAIQIGKLAIYLGHMVLQ